MTKQSGQKQNQRGVALLVALIVLLFMAIIGVGFMFMADTESSVNNNYRDSQKSYFASRAGAENVRVLLAGGNLNTQVSNLDGVMPTSTGGVIYVYNPTGSETISVTSGDYVDDELCQEQFPTLNSSLSYTTVTPGVPCAAPGISSYFTKATGLNVNSSNPALSDIPYTGTASALPFKWVRITNKQNMMGLLNKGDSTSTSASKFFVDPTKAGGLQVCIDATLTERVISSGSCKTQLINMKPVWLLTSMAVTPKIGNRPGSRRITQMEVALAPALMPPGTISAEAPLLFHGSSVNVDGTDNCSCTSCTTNNSGITSCANRGSASCDTTHHSAFTAGTISTQGGPTATTMYGSDLTGAATIQGVSPWPYNVGDLINSYKASATPAPFTSSCTGTTNLTAIPPVYIACGTQSNQTFGKYPGMDSTGALTGSPAAQPQTTYIPGSVQLTAGATGAGILIVDGDLDIHGGLQFYGLVLVRGQVTFSGGGSDKTNLYGAILAGGDVSNSKQCANPDDNLCTDSVGGSVQLHYDSCALNNATTNISPRLVAMHEIQY